MPYIYFFILLLFLVIYSLLITWQIYKIISLDLLFTDSMITFNKQYDFSRLFYILSILSHKKLWFDALKLLESQKNILNSNTHYYFNAIGKIYQNMQQYNLAKLYFLKSLKVKKDYSIALNNLSKLKEL